MTSSELLPSLSLMTLVIVALAVGVSLLIFLRRRSNRHPMEGRQERNVGADLDAGREPPDRSPPV